MQRHPEALDSLVAIAKGNAPSTPSSLVKSACALKELSRSDWICFASDFEFLSEGLRHIWEVQIKPEELSRISGGSSVNVLVSWVIRNFGGGHHGSEENSMAWKELVPGGN